MTNPILSALNFETSGLDPADTIIEITYGKTVLCGSIYNPVTMSMEGFCRLSGGPCIAGSLASVASAIAGPKPKKDQITTIVADLPKSARVTVYSRKALRKFYA